MTGLEVQFITHATLRITGPFGTLLCDPWFLNEPVFNLSTWKYPPARVPPEEVVKDVDYLFITHTHEDHFHIPSINYIDRDTPVFLPAYDEHPSLRAHTSERVMRAMGFHDIRRLKSWETVMLGGLTPLTRVPSAVERSHDWENSGFVIESPDCVLLNVNDNLNDVALCKDIKARWPEIDIVFIQSGGVTMFPGCFRMSEDEMRREADKRKVAFADQRRMLDHVKPKRIAPFAGDFCWLDDKYFHNNWANRTTAALFEDMMNTDYAQSGCELVQLYPGDRWSVDGGIVRTKGEINWDRMLEDISELQKRFRPKLDAINAYLNDVSYEGFEARSRARTDLVQKYITRDYIDFDARIRHTIEGPHSGFSFVLKANSETGLVIDWDDEGEVMQTLYVPENIWAAILEGRLMWNIVQWVGEAEQLGDYVQDLGRFWFWLEYHLDLNAKNIQAIIEPMLIPGLDQPIRPDAAYFPMAGEWDADAT